MMIMRVRLKCRYGQVQMQVILECGKAFSFSEIQCKKHIKTFLVAVFCAFIEEHSSRQTVA